jgi:protein SCO1
MKAVLVLMLVLAHASAFAQALAPARAGPLAPTPTAPVATFEQHLDATLPLSAAFTDSSGQTMPLAGEFPSTTPRPVLLMLGYHRCPQLCGLAMHGLLESLYASGMPPASLRILFVSVDPTETATDAAAHCHADLDYARFLIGDTPFVAPSIERLVGTPASIAALAARVGFVYQPGDAAARFAHPAGVIVVTPDGRVSRYLMGVRVDPSELRAAVADAAGGRVGTLSDRLALLCAHLDVRTGVHSEAVLAGVRIIGLTLLAALALFVWRQRAAHRPESR